MQSFSKYSLCLILLLRFSSLGFSQWQPLDLSFGNGNNVKHMFSDPYLGDLILTGVITEVNGVEPFASVLRWNGLELSGISGPANSDWINIWGNGLAGVAHKGKLFIGGAFTNGMEESYYPNLAIWDTAGTWDAVPFLSGSVESISVIDSIVYAGVSTSSSDSAPTCFYTYDGTTWDSLSIEAISTGSGGFFKGGMIRYGDRYFCGGNFQGPDGSDIFEWLGADEFIPSWPGQSGPGFISDMVVYNGELVVAGTFTESFGNPGNCIAAYDGVDWHPLYNNNGAERIGFSPGVLDLFVHEGILYAVGAFDLIDGQEANHVACWNGSEWHGLGSAEFQTVLCATMYKDTLYVGGTLNLDTFPSRRKIAMYLGELPSVHNSVQQMDDNEISLTVHPNPSTGNLVLSGKEIIQKVQVMDLLGRTVYEVQPDILGLAVTMDLSFLAKQAYVVMVTTVNNTQAIKVVFQ